MIRSRLQGVPFSRHLFSTGVLLVLLSLTFWLYVRQERQTDAANEARIRSVLLTTELRDSSDDLTRMARSFVVTRDERFRARYQAILDIRNGKQPRPDEYLEEFDVARRPGRPGAAEARRSPFLEHARRYGVGEAELRLLALSLQRSDALTTIEQQAMQLARIDGPEGRERALAMLFGPDYEQAKAAIIAPLKQVHQATNARTSDMVARSVAAANLVRALLVLLGVLLFLMMAQAYRSLRTILGGPVEDVHERIRQIGAGSLDLPPEPERAPAGSVMHWLGETQRNLARLDAGRRLAEERSVRLAEMHHALGQCSLAMARCDTEDQLFQEVCQAIVKFGGLDMAWVGIAGDGRLAPLASAGAGAQYAHDIVVATDARDPAGQGPSARAFRGDAAVWSNDFCHDPASAPWRAVAAQYGWRASAALPLHRRGTVLGVLSLYSTRLHAFDESAQEWLHKLVLGLDEALANLERKREHERAVADLAASQALLLAVINTAPVRIFWKDPQLRYLGCNPAFARDAGLDDVRQVVGKSDYDLAWEDQAERYRSDDRRVLRTGQPLLFYEERLTGAKGEHFWIRTSKVPLRDEHQRLIGLLGLYEDITQQRHAQEKIEYMANFDPLTGLANRARFGARFDAAIAFCKRGRGQLALMVLDLDHFKDINDALGHSVGDAVLVELAQRLGAHLREEDSLARFGGDEFVFVLPDCGAEDADFAAQRLLDTIAAPFVVEQYRLSVSASIGIALYPNDGLDLETLFKSADGAMYSAKGSGRRGYCFATRAMAQVSERNLQLVNAMREGIEQEQFQLYFQPQLSLHDDGLVGAEVLLRWRHPELGTVEPDEFIRAAEHTGLIVPLGQFVLRATARYARELRARAGFPVVLAVNLSVVQFRIPELAEMIAALLKEEGIEPDALELELTESMAMTDPEHVIAVLDKLRAIGLRISIDDFGTGYSSLSYLKRLRIHKLKIDRSFVQDVGTNPDDRTIVGAIIQMARQLGISTIAEGVETQAQLDYLRAQGCDEIQGFYYGRPMPFDEFVSFAAAHAPHRAGADGRASPPFAA